MAVRVADQLWLCLDTRPFPMQQRHSSGRSPQGTARAYMPTSRCSGSVQRTLWVQGDRFKAERSACPSCQRAQLLLESKVKFQSLCSSIRMWSTCGLDASFALEPSEQNLVKARRPPFSYPCACTSRNIPVGVQRLDYTLAFIDHQKPGRWLREVSASGEVPVLHDSGQWFAQATAIAKHLEDQYQMPSDKSFQIPCAALLLQPYLQAYLATTTPSAFAIGVDLRCQLEKVEAYLQACPPRRPASGMGPADALLVCISLFALLPVSPELVA